MKAIALVRVSTKAQELDSQREKVIQAILDDGYSESDIIPIEDKESGSKLSEEERSGLNKLKRHIETDHISSVYVYEISRISRKEAILYSIRDYLQKHQVQLVCLVPYFKMFNPDWSISEQAAFTFSIFSTLSSQETRVRTARMMRGKEKKTAEGKLSVGRPVFGYTLDSEHRPIPHPQESVIIKEIFERYISGETSGSIGKDLWLRNALHTKSNKLLTYKTYTSWLLKDRRYAKMDSDSIYPPIIPKSMFIKAQEILHNTPKYFKSKADSKEVYPLKGHIFTPDGYHLTPSISNNRYVKMNGASKEPISLNMKAANSLSIQVMNKYLNSGVLEHDRIKEYDSLNARYQKDKIKLKTIELRIHELETENSRINRRIISGRLSEFEGDKMIDDNITQIRTFEDLIQDLTYSLGVMNNKLAVLSNPLLEIENDNEVKDLEQLQEAVNKYISKIIVNKIGFSRYKLVYHFLDGVIISGCFYSVNKKLEFYDIHDE